MGKLPPDCVVVDAESWIDEQESIIDDSDLVKPAPFRFTRAGGHLEWTRKKLHHPSLGFLVSTRLAERTRANLRHSSVCLLTNTSAGGTGKKKASSLRLFAACEKEPRATQNVARMERSGIRGQIARS
jgi:hypothetical protein